MASIYEVAREAGVSALTVSRMFRAPDSLGHDTRRRVQDAIERIGYRPRRWRAADPAQAAAAQAPSTDASHTIGFQFFAEWRADTLQANAFYSEVFAGAQAEADAGGLYLLANTADRHGLSSQMPRMVRDQAVSGMLLVGTADREILASFADLVPDLILVDNRDAEGRFDCVVSDGFGGMRAATKRLQQMGHRRIGFVLGDRLAVTFADRLHGYATAQFEAGIAYDPSLVVAAESAEELYRDIVVCLRSSDRPTAILAANDTYALNVIAACRELGLQIPTDLSLIGFDDIPFISHTVPPLTTLRVDKPQMGRRAVQRLQARLRFDREHPGSVDSPYSIVLPVALIERESCAPPRGANTRD